MIDTSGSAQLQSQNRSQVKVSLFSKHSWKMMSLSWFWDQSKYSRDNRKRDERQRSHLAPTSTQLRCLCLLKIIQRHSTLLCTRTPTIIDSRKAIINVARRVTSRIATIGEKQTTKLKRELWHRAVGLKSCAWSFLSWWLNSMTGTRIARSWTCWFRVRKSGSAMTQSSESWQTSWTRRSSVSQGPQIWQKSRLKGQSRLAQGTSKEC